MGMMQFQVADLHAHDGWRLGEAQEEVGVVAIRALGVVGLYIGEEGLQPDDRTVQSSVGVPWASICSRSFFCRSFSASSPVCLSFGPLRSLRSSRSPAGPSNLQYHAVRFLR